MYQFSMWWYWGLAGLFLRREDAQTRHGQMVSALTNGEWIGEKTYEFWESIGKAWVSMAAAVGVVSGLVLLVLRPGSDTFDAAIIVPALLFGFAAGGALSVAPAIYTAWYRRHGPRPLAPTRGASGWWMLAIQIPAAVLLAFIVR